VADDQLPLPAVARRYLVARQRAWNGPASATRRSPSADGLPTELQHQPAAMTTSASISTGMSNGREA
jgi:hypothetical protein